MRRIYDDPRALKPKQFWRLPQDERKVMWFRVGFEEGGDSGSSGFKVGEI